MVVAVALEAIPLTPALLVVDATLRTLAPLVLSPRINLVRVTMPSTNSTTYLVSDCVRKYARFLIG
jgi:hypothetical protein